MTLQKIVNRLNDLERRLAELEAREAAPVYSSLQRDGKIGMSGSQLTPADWARINYNNSNVTEDFTSATPAGWSWAGSPFVTPAEFGILNNTWLYMRETAGGRRSFFYKTDIPNMLTFAMFPVMNTGEDGMYIGIRFDDGTDDNYTEVVLRYSSSGNQFRVYYVSRIDGGSVVETEVTSLATNLFDGWLYHEVPGTRWSSWNSLASLGSRSGSRTRTNIVGPTMTFTPARVGIVAKFIYGGWGNVGVDAVNF